MPGGTRPAVRDGAPTEGQTARAAEVQERIDALTEGVPADPDRRSPEEHGRWLLAQVLDWHRRDEKPAWWLWHDLRTKSTEDLIEASEGIGGLRYLEDVEQIAQSVVRRYGFPPQDHKFRRGSKVVDPSPAHGDFGSDAGEVMDVDDVHGTIDLKRGPSRLGYHPTSLIPTKPIGAGPMPAALLRIADHVIANGIEGDGPFRAARDLLTRRPPRIGGVEAGTPLIRPGEDLVDGARRIAAGLEDTVLPIQGPPGTGKTYTGARMIVELIRRGSTRRCGRPVAQGDHQHARGGQRSRGRGRRAASSRSRSAIRAMSSATIQAFGWPPTTRRSRPGSGTADSTWPQEPSGCSPARRCSRPSMCCSSTRQGRCPWPTSSR